MPSINYKVFYIYKHSTEDSLLQQNTKYLLYAGFFLYYSQCYGHKVSGVAIQNKWGVGGAQNISKLYSFIATCFYAFPH